MPFSQQPGKMKTAQMNTIDSSLPEICSVELLITFGISLKI